MAAMEDVVVMPNDRQSLVERDPAAEPSQDSGSPEDIVSTLDWFRKAFSAIASRGETITIAEWETALQLPVSLH